MHQLYQLLGALIHESAIMAAAGSLRMRRSDLQLVRLFGLAIFQNTAAYVVDLRS